MVLNIIFGIFLVMLILLCFVVIIHYIFDLAKDVKFIHDLSRYRKDLNEFLQLKQVINRLDKNNLELSKRLSYLETDFKLHKKNEKPLGKPIDKSHPKQKPKTKSQTEQVTEQLAAKGMAV